MLIILKCDTSFLSIHSGFQRIELLVKHYKYPEALSLALSFYEDKAMAVVGMQQKLYLLLRIKLSVKYRSACNEPHFINFYRASRF